MNHPLRLMLAGMAAMGGTVVHAETTSRPSEYRKDVPVELIYRQQIDDVYFTDWYGRVEKSDGPWRDIYFETNDKYVNKGPDTTSKPMSPKAEAMTFAPRSCPS